MSEGGKVRKQPRQAKFNDTAIIYRKIGKSVTQYPNEKIGEAEYEEKFGWKNRYIFIHHDNIHKIGNKGRDGAMKFICQPLTQSFTVITPIII